MIDSTYLIVTWLSIGFTFAFGFCFLFQKTPSIPALSNYKKARIAMAAAYISLSILNVVEILTRSESPDIELTQSITLIMSAFQALLYTYMFITLINIHFVTKKKIFLEAGGIIALSVLLFVTLFIDAERLYFKAAFYTFMAYYVIMLLRYTIAFLKNHRHYINQADNFFSEEGAERLRWVYYSFFAALTVGIGAMLLTFSGNTIHYILFTVFFIGFYCYFGIKFISYTFFFEQIESIMEESTSLLEQTDRLSYYDLKESVDQWVLEKKYMKPGISIEQLSNELNTNRTYISNYINSYYNQTFSNWINNFRIEEAKGILLENPELTIVEVSQIVGYADKSNFGREFAKRVGTPPGIWRKTQLDDE